MAACTPRQAGEVRRPTSVKSRSDRPSASRGCTKSVIRSVTSMCCASRCSSSGSSCRSASCAAGRRVGSARAGAAVPLGRADPLQAQHAVAAAPRPGEDGQAARQRTGSVAACIGAQRVACACSQLSPRMLADASAARRSRRASSCVERAHRLQQRPHDRRSPAGGACLQARLRQRRAAGSSSACLTSTARSQAGAAGRTGSCLRQYSKSWAAAVAARTPMPTAFANDSIQFMLWPAHAAAPQSGALPTHRKRGGGTKQAPTTSLRAALPLHSRLLLRQYKGPWALVHTGGLISACL